MYPNMPKLPKKGIYTALNTILDEAANGNKKVTTRVTLKVRHTSVTVPHSKHKKPRLVDAVYTENKREAVVLPFTVLRQVLRFCLNNAVSLCKGKLILQINGIPQGDNLSPAMAIGTCAYKERKWLKTVPAEIKKRVVVKRYMDDVCAISNAHDKEAKRAPCLS